MMTVPRTEDIESLDGFQNLDKSNDWQSHEPGFEWTDDDLMAFEYDLMVEEQERLTPALAAWWDLEGVRCATFGRDPNQNPYR